MQTEEDIRRRISAIFAEYSLSENALADDSAAVQKRLNRQLSHGARITADTLLLILNSHPSVSAEWLMRGIGEMERPSDKGGVVVSGNSVGGIGTFSNINAGDTINRLVALLEEKDKQINQLLQLLAKK